MGAIANEQQHVLLHAFPGAWGHNKPLCAFAVKILEAQPEIVVTYLTSSLMYPKVMAELKRLPPSRYKAIGTRLHVVDMTGPVDDPFKPLDFTPTFTQVYASHPITCFSSGKTISGLPSPKLAIIDPFAAYAFESIRAVAGSRLPILAWWTGNAGALLRLLGPAHLGGVVLPELETTWGRAATKAKIFAGEPIKFHRLEGKVVNVPGLAPSYDYEWFTQETPLTDAAAVVEKTGSIYIREADGVLCVSAAAYEAEAVSAAKQWYASMNKVFYTVGPLNIHEPGVEDIALRTVSESDSKVAEFLDRMQTRFGSKSLVYMSFGTLFWPVNSERIFAVVEGLIAKRQPFIFAHPSPFAQFPDEMKKRISESGIAMELSWSPQELILSHPVAGWFITHGGWNSLQEAFMYRVPLIIWPYQADQPYNAIHMSRDLKAAFELIEVRTGDNGMRRPFVCPVMPAFTPESAKTEIQELIDRLNGKEGSVVRKNFEMLAEAMGKTWDLKSGEAKKDMENMLKDFI